MQNKQQKHNWVTHPSKRNLMIMLVVWMVANGLLVISITDLFSEQFFSKRYMLIYMLMLMSTGTVVRVISNYFMSKV